MRHIKLKKVLLLSTVLAFVSSASQAAIVVTHKAVDTSNTSQHALTSASFTPSVGDIINVHGTVRLAASGDVVVLSSSVEGAFTAGNVTECRIASGANGGYSGWIKVAIGGAQTITVSDGSGAAVATGLQLSVETLANVDQTTPEDTTVRGTCSGNQGNAANPTGTSGSTSVAGEAIISHYATPTTAGYSPTLDGAWTNLATSGNSVMDWSGAYLLKAGTGTQTRQDTVTSRLYSYTFQGFRPAGAVTNTNKFMFKSSP